jgi:hypothetical protein
MKKSLFIHIGLPKTGTTVLQSTFKDLADNFRKENIEFVNFDSFAREIRLGKVPECKDFFRELDKKLLDSYKVFLSSEFLTGMDSTSFNLVPVRKIAQCLKDAAGDFFDVKIILYLRRIDLWIESMYTQFISDGGYLRFSEFMLEHKLEDFDYSNLIEGYESIFGQDNIILRIYDKKHLPEKDSLLKDFAEIIGSKYLAEVDLNSYSEKKSNSGFNSNAVEIARLCMPQATRDEQKRIREVLQYSSRKIPFQKNAFFDMNERRVYLEERMHSMSEICRKYFPDYKGNDIFSELEDIQPVPQFLSVEDAVRSITFAILAPSEYEYIETLRTLQILYKIETGLKKSVLLKALMKMILRLFGIKDKEKSL